ncbi:MAG: PEP-CTERM sorting domain-containing protein [Desulfobacterium sp.]|nr:PEP-CTERM sorting domain-containing protein [Desulfobacterium sp.]
MKKIRLYVILLSFCVSGTAFAIPMGGIELSGTIVSFTNTVHSYIPVNHIGGNDNDPGGGMGFSDDLSQNDFVSLGPGGSLLLQLMDDFLTVYSWLDRVSMFEQPSIIAVGTINSPLPVEPVPEPATFVLIGLGFIGFWGINRKRLRQ